MNFAPPNILLYFVSWLTCVAGIWKLFEIVEDTAKSKVKTEVSKWLNGKNPREKKISWISKFPDIFDSVFGRKHFSFRCFLKSSIASTFIVFVATLGWGAFYPEKFSQSFATTEIKKTVMYLFMGLWMFNLMADYFSLLETRYIIRIMSQTKSITKLYVLLFVDFIASLLILSIGVSINVLFLRTFFKETYALIPPRSLFLLPVNSVAFFIDIFRYKTLLFQDPGNPSLGIFVYSSLFTSIWVWLYFLSISLLKVNRYLIKSLSFFKNYLDIDNKPFRSIGAFAIIIITAIYFLFIPIAKLFFK